MPTPLRHCGLDFGTSNSTLALAPAGNDAPRLLPLEAGRPTIPSVIFFDFDEDRELYGRAAIAEYISGTDGRMMRSLKSILGSSLAEEKVRIKQRIHELPPDHRLLLSANSNSAPRPTPRRAAPRQRSARPPAIRT